MIWYMFAAFFPCVLIILFSVVTRSKWVGTIITLILIGVSVQKGFFHSNWIIFIDVVSLLAGYVIVDRLKFHQRSEDDD
ncbi:CsbA family protein [Staphylococcus auricularis]|uniref:CsbA family protein n=1 Tax=Staphylococcus auricularis TaxID=29379 RepID=UPI003EB7EF89